MGEHNLSLIEPPVNNDHRYFNVLSELTEPYLVRREKGEKGSYLTMDKSLQLVLLLKLKQNFKKRQEAFQRAVSILRASILIPSHPHRTEASSWTVALSILPHLLSIVEAHDLSKPWLEASQVFAEILADVGMRLFDRGITAEASILLEKAEEILADLDDVTEMIGNVLTALGSCTDTFGISQRAKGLEVRQRCLEVRENDYAAIHDESTKRRRKILLCNAKLDKACSLQQFNRMPEVDEICQQLFNKYQSWVPKHEFPVEYAKYVNHMAYVHLSRGETEKAIEDAEKAYSIVRDTPNAQLTVRFKFDWASVMFQNKEVDRAIEEHELILESRIRDFGKQHVLTMQSRLNLGIMYCLVGDLFHAEYVCWLILRYRCRYSWLTVIRKFIRQTLKVDKKVHWPIENRVRAKYYLAQTLLKGNTHSEEARRLDLEAKSTLEELLCLGGLESIKEYLEPKNYPILFDYIVPWECRLVTPWSLES